MRNPIVRAAAVILAAAMLVAPIRRVLAAENDSTSTGPVDAAEEERVIGENCEICHTDKLIRQQHLNSKLWLSEVQKMKAWGSPLDEAQIPQLAAYLTKLYGLDAPPFAAESIPAAKELDLYKPVGKAPAGNVAKGHALYNEDCANCHGQDALGSVGPRLVDVPDLWRWNDFETAVIAGRGKMPSFRGALELQQAADILAWLRTLDLEPEKEVTK